MTDNTFIIYTDGGARGNPGIAGAGVSITNGEGEVLKSIAQPLGTQTNNYAEYEAVIVALEAVKTLVPKARHKETIIDLRTDSELVVKQLNGEYQIKDEGLCKQFMRIWNLRVGHFPKTTFTHVRREDNKEADRLSNVAMDTPLS